MTDRTAHEIILAIVDAASPLVASSSPAADNAQPSQMGEMPAKHAAGKKKGGAQRGAGGGGSDGAAPPEDGHKLNLRLAFLPLTDLGNAERFRERYKGRLLYCETLPGGSRSEGGWLAWDTRRWSTRNASAEVRRAEHDTVRAIQKEAEACVKEADRLAADYADIVERKPPPKKKSAVRERKDNVIVVEFRPKKVKAKPELAADAAATPAAAPDGAMAGKPAPADKPADKRKPVDAGAIASRITSLYLQASRLRAYGRQSEFNSRMTPIARHASAYMLVDQAELDRDLFAFNVLNGTLVFRRKWPATPNLPKADALKVMDDPALYGHEIWTVVGPHIKFKPHDPSDLMTMMAPIAFDPAAACPQFEAFLARVQPEPAMRTFLQQWKGYQLTGDTSEARMCLFLGRGRNGKGTFEEATAFVLGDYAESTAIETFTLEGKSRSAGQPTPELAKLPGKRSLRSSEPKKGSILNEQLIKIVTGGDPIEARHLNRPYFTYYAHFKWTVSSNYTPKIPGTDDGIWARVTKVPWDVFVPKEERDLQLREKLKAEAPGILNWMLRGLADWFARGLVLPDKVVAATEEYRKDSDQLGRWLAACTTAKKGARMQSSTALESFNAFAKVSGGSEWKNRGFADAMAERGFKKIQSNVMFWLDLELVKFAHDFVDEQGRPKTNLGGETGHLDAPDAGNAAQHRDDDGDDDDDGGLKF